MSLEENVTKVVDVLFLVSCDFAVTTTCLESRYCAQFHILDLRKLIPLPVTICQRHKGVEIHLRLIFDSTMLRCSILLHFHIIFSLNVERCRHTSSHLFAGAL